MKLGHDLIIPAGTEFECIDGTKREYVEGNYEALIAAGPDHTISVVMEPEALTAVANSVRGSEASQALSEFRAMKTQ